MGNLFKSIRSRILVSYFLYVLVIVLISLGALYFQATSKLYNLLIGKSIEESRIYSQVISEKIEKDIFTLQCFAENIAINNYSEESIKSTLLSIANGNKNREVKAIYANTEGIAVDENGVEGIIVERKYFQTLKNSRMMHYVSNPVMGKITKRPVVVAAVPLRNENGEFKGVIGISTKLTELSKIIEDIEFEHNSFAWIVSESGEIISHSNENYPMKLNILDFEEQGFTNFHKVASQMFKLSEGSGEYFDKDTNQKKVIAFSVIKNTPGWKLCISSDKNQIYGEANVIWKKTLIITSIMIFLFLIVAFKAGDAIINPIKELTASVRKSVSSNFEPLDLNISNDKEIEELIVTFNEMNLAISVYTEELEHIVAERTEELAVLNKKLAEQNELLSVENKTLHHKASRDVLTGLYNRGALNAKLEFTVQEIREELLNECSILFLDLDNFKYYNDTFGHDIGDKILKFITEYFTRKLRKNEFIARYGGDEFVAVLPNIEKSLALNIKDSINSGLLKLDGLKEQLKEWSGFEEINISNDKLLAVSIGVHHFNESNLDSVKNLIIKADMRMYEEKSRRKLKR